MLKLLVYGYSYGIRSSRKLERETHYNLSFIWLSGGLKPDFKTIAEFRRNNKAALANVLKQCARLCMKLGLIEGNTLFVDGSKIRANDPDCTKMHSRQGSHAGYNAQTVVDEKHGLIASADVVNENNDLHQFSGQVERARETLGKKPHAACADSGYSDIDELEKVNNQGIKVVVPTTRQASDKERGPFDKSNFSYDHESKRSSCRLVISSTTSRLAAFYYEVFMVSKRRCLFCQAALTLRE
jgi:hypothetical protein